MSNQNVKLSAGVWMDNQNAMVISRPEASNLEDFEIRNKVKSKEYHGGKGEHGSNNADQANSQHFYKDIAHLLLPFDEILIFGPGKAQEEFQNYLKADMHFDRKKIVIDSADRLSDPQMIAKVRTHFAD
jgi:stalled ribosome rescue protein Dom34